MQEKRLAASSDQQPAEKFALPVEKTYGEKWHSFIFDTLINFWVNLIASGIFNYWAHNFNKPSIFAGNVAPPERYERLRSGLEKLLPEARRGPNGPASAMANAIALTTPGHLIMIPSVWLGAKFKTPIVNWIDRMYYGKDCDNDARIAERHQIIAHELKPTLLGATLGRVGTWFACQAYAYTLGAKHNLVNWLGKKLNVKFLQGFTGLDHVAETAGLVLGREVASQAPVTDAKWNRMARNVGFGWSKDQLAKPPVGATKEYNYFMEDVGRWIFLDIIYTTITSFTINPIVRKLREYLPGMAYRETPQPNVLARAPVHDADHEDRADEEKPHAHPHKNHTHRRDDRHGRPDNHVTDAEHHHKHHAHAGVSA